MIKKSLLIVFAILFALNTSVFAWSRSGHQMVVELAFNLLSKPSQDKLKAFLGNMSIEDAATWMDEIRGSDKQYAYLTSTHFINIDKGGKLDPFQKGTIYTELNSVIGELEKGSPADMKLDLLILIHLVGDIHQPLHVGYGNDKGGNEIKVSFLGKPTSLHSVWDGGIIGAEHITLQTVMNRYAKLSASEVAAIKTENVAAWLSDSRSYLPQIYSFSNSTIDENYVQKATPVVEDQLMKAGIRLAGVLEKVLDKAAAPAPVAQAPVLKPGTVFTAFEGKDHVGEKITVCDKVFGTRFLENANGQPTFLNLGAVYPNSPFTVVIFGNDRGNFKERPEIFYNDKKVCATGLIKMYNGKPEMIIANENEIKVSN